MSRTEQTNGAVILDREMNTLVSFPNVIETFADEPVLLSELMSSELTGGAGNLTITHIDGHAVGGDVAMALPGVRIGEGEGTGFVMRREADGEFVFIPDADYCGITTFTFTVADRTNEEATLLATLSVRGQIVEHSDISFADGSSTASVFEGVESTILGALTLASPESGDNFLFTIFEGDTQVPSTRFTVIGDKLHATERLDHAADGTIMLRVVAEDGENHIGPSQIAVEVRPIGESTLAGIADQFKFATSGSDSNTSTTSGRHLALVIGDDDLAEHDRSDDTDRSETAMHADTTAITDATGVADGIARGPSSDVDSL